MSEKKENLIEKITNQFEQELNSMTQDEKIEYLKSYGFAVKAKDENKNAKNPPNKLLKSNSNIKKVSKKLNKIEGIKLEISKVYNEYSVIVIYDDGSDIIICQTAKEAEKIYEKLNKKFEDFKAKHNSNSIV